MGTLGATKAGNQHDLADLPPILIIWPTLLASLCQALCRRLGHSALQGQPWKPCPRSLWLRWRRQHGSDCHTDLRLLLLLAFYQKILRCFKEPQWRPMDRSRCPEASRTHMPEASSCQTGEATALWGQLVCKGPVVRGKHEALKRSH